MHANYFASNGLQLKRVSDAGQKKPAVAGFLKVICQLIWRLMQAQVSVLLRRQVPALGSVQAGRAPQE